MASRIFTSTSHTVHNWQITGWLSFKKWYPISRWVGRLEGSAVWQAGELSWWGTNIKDFKCISTSKILMLHYFKTCMSTSLSYEIHADDNNLQKSIKMSYENSIAHINKQLFSFICQFGQNPLLTGAAPKSCKCLEIPAISLLDLYEKHVYRYCNMSSTNWR